jgi:thiosulfate/3-mercaptopyruvate sulfurtransferase
MTHALITPAELAAHIHDVKILDASYGVLDAPGAFTAAHIGDAQFFDIDTVADPAARYAHTLPAPEDFAKAVGQLGIGNDDAVVVYDQTGISFAAARAWWMFRVMGHKDVRVLNGGLRAWIEAGLPVQSGLAKTPAPKAYAAHYRPELYKNFEAVEDNAAGTVIDARGPERFNATMHTPDGDAVPAHIPGSVNQPYVALLDSKGALKAADDYTPLLEKFKGQPVTMSCGSGVTACVLALGFYEAGLGEAAVFDGSWTEWADRNALR